MVGVAGKYVGCNTCRERRIKKCTNERPFCKNCINAGRECGGYSRNRVFIVGTLEERGRCSSHPHRTLMAPRAKARPTKLAKSRAFSGNLKLYNDPLVRIPDAILNRMQCLALHTNILSLESVHESSDGNPTMPPLMDCLPELTQRSPALERALRALYLIHMGVNMKDDRLVKESTSINTEAMTMVRMAIMNPRTSNKIETLAASICLYLYEQAACLRERVGAWRVLFRGSSFLVQQRGAAAYKNFPDHHFFVRLFRTNAAFDAMSLRKATFLAQPEWCTLPWENIPKNDMDLLFDIHVLLPGIFEREEKLEKLAPSANRRQQAKQLMEYCEEVDKKFQDWYDGLQARAGKPLFWSIPRQHHTEETVKALGFDMCSLFPNYIQFADLNTCFLHMYYWAGLSLFYRKMQHIHRYSNEDVRHWPSQSQDDTVTEAATNAPANVTPALSLPPAHSYQNMLADPFARSNSPAIETPYQKMLMQASMASTLVPTDMGFQFMPADEFMLSNSKKSDHPYQSFLSIPSASSNQLSFDTSLPKTIRSTPPPPLPSTAHSRTSSSSPQPAEGTTPLDDKYTESSILTLGKLICQSLPFALNRTLRSFGPDHSTWPLWIAFQVFKRRGYTDEAEWCRKMMEMWEREGWKFAINMGRVEWKEYRVDDVGVRPELGRGVFLY